MSRVFDSPEQHCFAQIKKELVIRVTPSQRYEIRILFYEDDRKIESICIQRFTAGTDKPHRQSFTFFGDEIAKIYDLLRAIKYLDLSEDEKQRLDDEILDDLIVSTGQKKQFLLQNVDLIVDLLSHDLTTTDIVALAYRKEQLDEFDRLLHDPLYFSDTQRGVKNMGRKLSGRISLKGILGFSATD